MSLSKQDLKAIQQIVDRTLTDRVPLMLNEHVQPMLDQLEKRLTVKIDQLTLDVGHFSLETTGNFIHVNARFNELNDKLSSPVVH
jgi:hypothetical protein